VRSIKVQRNIRGFRCGVGLVELLIALSISSLLLTAVGVALDASFISYRVNQEQSALTQRARLAMHRILTSVRRCDAHAPATGSLLDEFALGLRIDDTGIAMIDDAGDDLVYNYDAANERVLFSRNGVSRTLMEGVTQFQVSLEPMRSPTSIRTGGGYDLLNRATVLLTVRTTAVTSRNSETTGNQSVTLSSSAQPRRNVW